MPVEDVWWDAFERHVRVPFRDDVPSMEQWGKFRADGDFGHLKRFGKRGQVGASDDPRGALWQAFLYQRGHLNAFRASLMRPLRLWRDDRDRLRTVNVLDVGCGAGTVAFAFHELLDGDCDVRYVGVDHHEPTRDLCESMVGELTSDLAVVGSVSEALDAGLTVLRPRRDRVFVTFSYLFGQGGCTAAVVDELVELVVRVVAAVGKVRVIVADSPGIKTRTPEFINGLESAETVGLVKDLSNTVPYNFSFPRLQERDFRQSRPRVLEYRYLVLAPQ